jgi:hypothetical protein
VGKEEWSGQVATWNYGREVDMVAEGNEAVIRHHTRILWELHVFGVYVSVVGSIWFGVGVRGWIMGGGCKIRVQDTIG